MASADPAATVSASPPHAGAGHDVFLSSAWHGVDRIRSELADWLERSGYPSFVFERFQSQTEWKALLPAAREAICLEHIGRSRLYVGIFRDTYGSSASDHNADVAFTDLEFFEAFRAGIPMRLYHLADGTPDPRLAALLTLIEVVVPHALVRVTRENALMESVRRDVDTYFNRRIPTVPPSSLFARYSRALIVHRKADDDRDDGIRFLLDRFPAPSLPFDRDLIKAGLSQARALASYEAQLNATWHVFQRLFHAPWRTSPDALELWDSALGVWDKASAWVGLHGFTYTGRLAADNTLIAVRALRASAGELASVHNLLRKGGPRTGTREEWTSLFATGGALASGYYSVAKQAPRSLRQHYLVKADSWVSVAERAFALEPDPGLEAGLASIRGNILLRLDRRPEAIASLERSLRLRQDNDLGEASVAEAKVDLGYAYFIHGRRSEGERLVMDGLAEFPRDEAHGQLARVKRKAVRMYAQGFFFRKALGELIDVKDLVDAYDLKDQGREARWLAYVPRFLLDSLRAAPKDDAGKS